MSVQTTDVLALQSADGAQFSAYAARAPQPTGAGVVILPGGRGLLPIYADLADRFSEAGIDAIAIDHFGRTAGLGLRDNQFDFAPHLAATSPAYTRLDVATALDHLRSTHGDVLRAAFVIGFSFGGAAAFLQATHAEHNLAGAIGCYGWPSGSEDFAHWPRPVDHAAAYHGALLGIFGGADERISQNEDRQFDEALAASGTEHWIVTCDGAPHGFVDRRAKEFPAQSAAAWRRALGFISGLTPDVA